MGATIYDGRYRCLISHLKNTRKSRGLDQAELGRMVGRSRSWVGKIERRETRLDVIQLIDLCHVLKVDVSRALRRMEE